MKNPYLADEERDLIASHTTDDHANLAGALRLRTNREQRDVQFEKPAVPELPETVAAATPERDDDTPLLDQTIEGERPPMDWALFRDAVAMLLIGISGATIALFVVLPTLINIHNTKAFTLTDNLIWWPVLSALLGVAIFAWQEGKSLLSTLFSTDAIIISIWY